jgi:hypothetical protein
MPFRAADSPTNVSGEGAISPPHGGGFDHQNSESAIKDWLLHQPLLKDDTHQNDDVQLCRPICRHC